MKTTHNAALDYFQQHGDWPAAWKIASQDEGLLPSATFASWQQFAAACIAQRIAERVASLTDRNDHTGARILIARSFHMDNHAAQLEAIKREHWERGHLTGAEYAEREAIALEIFGSLNQLDESGNTAAILDRSL